MQRYLIGALISAFVIGTTVTHAQGIPQPSNTPPPTVAEPRGVQRAPLPPSAQTKADAMVTMAGCIQEGATSLTATPPAAGPAAGTTGATPAEKAAERSGNVPDPHEGAAAGQRTAESGGDRRPADTRTGGGANAERASANNDLQGRDAHKVYVLTNATMAADGGRSRDVTGTSGLASPKGYRLEGDSAKLASHVNQQVRVSGTVQNPEVAGSDQPAAAGSTSAANAPILRVQSITTLAQKCQ